MWKIEKKSFFVPNFEVLFYGTRITLMQLNYIPKNNKKRNCNGNEIKVLKNHMMLKIWTEHNIWTKLLNKEWHGTSELLKVNHIMMCN